MVLWGLNLIRVRNKVYAYYRLVSKLIRMPAFSLAGILFRAVNGAAGRNDFLRLNI